jgi:heterodisulfide reductase subunit A-like polyferredoxin
LLKEDSFLPNHFYAVSDPEICTACGTCVENCSANCIRMDEISKIDSQMCYGCGACASTCPEKAIIMVRKTDEEIEKLDAEMIETAMGMFEKTSPNWDYGI